MAGNPVVAPRVPMNVRSNRVIAPLLLVLAVTACGDQGREATDPSPTESSVEAASELTITVKAGPEAPGETWTLTCEPAGGDHPDPEAACAALENAEGDPFAPVARGTACTQQFGGPQTATIAGTWRGEPVDASYKRTDGCEIARWDAISAVLGSGGA